MPRQSTPRAAMNTPASDEAAAAFNLMLRGLLHELRNPLSSILTAASLVQDTPPESGTISEETAMLMGVIQKESQRLNRILTEFSNYLKLPAPQPAAFDIAHLMRYLVAQLQRDGVLGSGVQIEDDLPEHSLVWADETQIRAALGHLLCNAGEAMPSGGVLRLSHQSSKGKVVICLSDSGAGFNAESEARAFQPFYSTKTHGIGLGLSATLAIVEAAGGRVWIENATPSTSSPKAPREQARVYIELPCAP